MVRQRIAAQHASERVLWLAAVLVAKCEVPGRIAPLCANPAPLQGRSRGRATILGTFQTIRGPHEREHQQQKLE